MRKTASFGAEYIPGLALVPGNYPHPKNLQALETLATMSWLAAWRKDFPSDLAKDRMAFVAARIPKMLHPDNEPYNISITLPSLNKAHFGCTRGCVESFGPDPLQTLALYSIMGLNTPNNMWAYLPESSLLKFLRFYGSGESECGHIFTIKSLFYPPRLFGNYKPPGRPGVIYLFFPTLGEYSANRDDADLMDAFKRLKYAALANSYFGYETLCDVRRFEFEWSSLE